WTRSGCATVISSISGTVSCHRRRSKTSSSSPIWCINYPNGPERLQERKRIVGEPASTNRETTIGVLLMAYGGPTSLDQIPDYLADVREGRQASEELLTEMTHRYAAIGGRSPILELT